MSGQICPFHSDEWIQPVPLGAGSNRYTCSLTSGHPGGGDWTWLSVPPPPTATVPKSLADALALDVRLPEAVKALGPGWFEYGLVERQYARSHPEDFAELVTRYKHTALGPQDYSTSTYLASTLGRLSRLGSVAYHDGPGTGRWSYDSHISWWSADPATPWEQRTAWVDVVDDQTAPQADGCAAYVPLP